ncbi:restriction endonuclease subunit S [Candidatus Thiodiazotropha sp. LNASS1]|uniref:restriction endonuclease subunit S n=1 Tax=Candidatus Thiodiazotropha sp. LNASS1 TaxID=3096260 RepID=UPI0034DDFE03
MNAVLEKVNELPDGWEMLAIEDIAEVNPRVNKTEISDDLIVSFVPMPAVEAESGTIDVSQERPFSEVKKGFTPFIEGDVLFAKITPCMENGKMAVVPKVKNGYGFGSTEFHVLRPKEEIESKYIYYFVSSRTFRGVAQHNMSGAVGQKRVPTNYIKQHLIPVAPPEQQKHIVAKIEELFSHIDAGIEALKKAQELLKQYRQSVLKAAVTGELTKEWREANKAKIEPASQLLERILKERREKWEEQQLEQLKAKGKVPKDDKWKEKYKDPNMGQDRFFGENPEEWEVASIDHLALDIRYGSSSKTSQDEKGVPVLRMGNIIDGNLDYSNLKYLPVDHDEFPDLLLHDGDLLFNRTNSKELVGKTAVFRDTGKQTSLASYLIRVRVLSEIEPDFVAFFINSSCGRNWVKSCVSQNVGQANVNGTKLKALALPLPSSNEQKVIVRRVEEKMQSSDKLLTELDHQLFKVEKNKQSILASAFSGSLNGANS